MADDVPVGARLSPYVPGLALRWPAGAQLPAWEVVEGTLVFADISGFTRLTEALSVRGKAGAEELTQLLDAIFVELLATAFEQGGELVTWGGDAVVLLYTGPHHARRAVLAARRMHRVMARSGRVPTSAGRSRLRMSVGVHSGPVHFFLVGGPHRELVLTGPAASETARLEAAAEAGEVLVSPATAALLPDAVLGAAKGGGRLVAATPRPVAVPERPSGPTGDPAGFLAPAVAAHLAAGPVDAEHRQVAVGFLEFSGVDELLAGAGPDAVAAALQEVIGRVQERCLHHGVTFWETDIGVDGGKVMLVAGAPTGTGDDPGRVLSVVREVLDGGGPLGLRAGVNAGRVFAGDFGPVGRRTFSVKGDAVNLAARLMGRAEPGQALVTAATLARSRIDVDAEALAPFSVKGRSAPVEAVALRAAGTTLRAAGTTLPGQPLERLPLAGREEELGLLRGLLASARAGRGSCVQLVGPPGIGKSRLVEELRRGAADSVVVSARCDAYRSAVPYAPWRDLLGQLLVPPRTAGPLDLADALVARVRRDAPELVPWMPLVAVVLGVAVPPTPEVDSLEERFRRDRLETVVSELLRVLLPGPGLVVIDDAHLLDEASASLLASLAATLGTAPWLVLLARRPEGGDGPAASSTVELAPLDDDAVGHLVQSLTGAAPLPPHRRAAVVARCAGNPLFALELAAAGTATAGELPDTVEQVIAAQVDRLPPADRGLLRAASVLGVQVPLDALSTMLDEPVAPDRLHRLADHLVPDGPGALRFRHGLVRDAAYEGLPFARRRRLHAAAGEALLRLAGPDPDDAAPLLAVHFAAAGDSPAAWRWGRVAADRAAQAYAHVEAAELAERALQAGREVAGVPAGELALVAGALGEARTHLGEFGRAEAAYRLACRWAQDPVEQAGAVYRIALAAERQGHYRRCLQRLTAAERVLAGAGDDDSAAARLRAELRAQYGLVRHRQGRGTEAVRLLREAVGMADATGLPDVLAPALLYLDTAELTLGLPGDGEHARRALALLRGTGDQPWLEARALNQLGIRAYYAGHWVQAVEHYTASRAGCERAGDTWTAAVASMNIAEVLSDQGHLTEARTALQAALDTYRAAGTSVFVADGTRLLGRIAAREGDATGAERLLTEARDIYRADGEVLETVLTDAVLAEAALLTGQPEVARRRALAALDASAALPGRGLVTPLLHRVLGLAGAELGDAGAALDALTTSIAAARARSATYELALSLRALCEVSPTPLPESEAELESLMAGLGIVDARTGAAARAAPPAPTEAVGATA